MLDRQVETALALQRKASERLKGMNMAEVSAGDLLRMLQLGVTMEKQARGLGVRVTEISEGGPFEAPVADMVSERMRALAPVDHDLLRHVSMKCLRLMQLEIGLSEPESQPEKPQP